jgi:hypothetical protein
MCCFEYNYEFCLYNGEGVSKDVKEEAHHVKLASDQDVEEVTESPQSRHCH